MIVGFKNVEEGRVHVCMEALSCPSLSGRVAAAAGRFALTLKRMDQVLLAIPAGVMRRIATRTGTGPLAAHISATIH